MVPDIQRKEWNLASNMMADWALPRSRLVRHNIPHWLYWRVVPISVHGDTMILLWDFHPLGFRQETHKPVLAGVGGVCRLSAVVTGGAAAVVLLVVLVALEAAVVSTALWALWMCVLVHGLFLSNWMVSGIPVGCLLLGAPWLSCTRAQVEQY